MLVLSVCLLLLSPVLGAAVQSPEPKQLKQDLEGKKVAEEEEKPGDLGLRKTRQDIPWAPSQARDADTPTEDGRTHFNSGFPTYSSGGHQPHVTLNLQAPWYSGPPHSAGGWISQGGPFPRPTSGVGCGGQTVQIQDTHFPTQQVPQTYTASVPFIAGYRLTPVIGQKQIVLNDLYGGAAASAAGCGYWQNFYGHAKQAQTQPAPEDILWPEIKTSTGVQAAPEDVMWPNIKSAMDMQAGPAAWPSGGGVVRVSPEEILRPFEEARYFQPPLEMEHGLEPPHVYQSRIDDLKHHLQHMESLRDSASDDDNLIAS